MISDQFLVLLEADNFITYEGNPADYQELVDPKDHEHTAKITGVKTFDNGSRALDQFLQTHTSYNPTDVPKFDGSPESKKNRKSYLYGITLIPLNDSDDKEYAHVIAVKILKKGKTNQDTRNTIYYVFYSDYGVDDSEITIDTLPITPRGTGIGSDDTNRRNFWNYKASNRQNTKNQDKLKPDNFSNLSNRSISSDRNTFISSNGVNQDAEFSAAEQERIDVENDRLTRAIRGSKRITLGNIESLVRTQRGKHANNTYFSKKKTGYLADLLAVFLKTPNNPQSIYPLKLTNSSKFDAVNTAHGIQGANSITTDFTEVIHPIALLTGNCTGNAKDMVIKFFGASGWDEIKEKAVISYPSATNYPLIDSEVFYPTDGGRGYSRLMVSSKKGGQKASFSGLNGAWTEAQQLARDSWIKDVVPKISNDFEFAAAWIVLQIGLRNLTGNAAKQYWLEAAEYLDIESGGDNIINEVVEKINAGTAFSQLVIWIYNHSAMIQVDTYVEEGGNDDNKPTVLNNIVATWPSQLVDSVKLEPGAAGVYLGVNGRKVDLLATAPELPDREGTTRSGADAEKTKLSHYGNMDPSKANPLQQVPQAAARVGAGRNTEYDPNIKINAAVSQLNSIGIKQSMYDQALDMATKKINGWSHQALTPAKQAELEKYKQIAKLIRTAKGAAIAESSSILRGILNR